MKRLIVSICLCLTALTVQAQINRGLKGGYDVEEFPKISFIWNSPNPEVLPESQFILTENDTALDIKVKPLVSEADKKQKKSILFIWEDMASHGQQSDFARMVIGSFFGQTTLNAGDRFNVAVFNRKKNTQRDVLQPLLPEFSTDATMLQNAVMGYSISRERFAPQPLLSDLYLAINEGIDMLKKEPADRISAIVVISAGLNIKVSGASTEMETVRKNALDADIPIYVVKYPMAGDTPEINTLSESTYGLYTLSKEPSVALSDLQSYYSNMSARSYGQDYRVTFTTKTKRDGKSHPISFSINKVQQQIPAYTAPNMTFELWVKENLVLFICLCAAVLLLIVLIIILLVNRKRKINQKLAQSEARVQDEINRSQQQMENMRQEQQRQEQLKQEEAIRKANQERENELASLMQSKNLYPRLQCNVGDRAFTATITKPTTRIGRNDNNDIVLPNQTVSGFHAEIVFNGNTFEVFNRSTSYTRGIIVNGQFFQQTTLRNGDMIGLGEATITFYL